MTEGKIDLVDQRHQKLVSIGKLGHDLYPHKYERTHNISDIVSLFSGKSREILENEKVSVRTAGRIMTMRGHGKVGFVDLVGESSRIQIYVRQDRIGEDNYSLFRLFDVGDIIGVKGEMFRTKTNELSIFANQLDFLAKSLFPLPEKWHGLSDVERRYRQRYLDLLVNPQVRSIFTTRSSIISEIRRFLEMNNYLEVETPMMQPVAGGAVARPFKTYHEALNIPLYLRIAPELYLKRLIVGGFERVFEINRNFRNEGVSTQHNPEFTMLEFYQAYGNYWDMMDLTEKMLCSVVKKLNGVLLLEYAEKKIDFSNFARYSMVEAIQLFWQGSPPTTSDLHSRSRVGGLLEKLGVEIEKDATWGKLLEILFEKVTERQLVQPTFIYDFPAELSPLAKRRDDDPRFAERFELFIAGMEIANAYSELNDPAEQRKRFQDQLAARNRGDQEAHEMDEDYLRVLGYGMPPTAGEGVGIDRLTMVLTNSASIREVILFPHLRPASKD